jgi:hypothetical protein
MSSTIDPKLREYARTQTQAKYIDAILQHGSMRKAATALGCHKNAVNEAVERVKKEAARMGYAPEHGMVHTVPDGFFVKGVSTYHTDTKQWVKSSVDMERQREIMRAAFDAMAEELPRAKPAKPPPVTDAALCNLIVFSDYHMGMLAWHKEGGADWNLKIAEKLLFDSFAYMVNSAPKAHKCVLCIQGDYLHTDGLLPLTPANKHVLDADSRFSKIVDAAVRVLRRLLALALERHESLHLIICEGNHDETGSMWMRKMFAALYENEPRLTVNDSELPFYVYQHGETMLGFHHGHKVKNESLPLLFAAQFPKLWGATSKRFVHCGHRHHVDEKEYNGMSVVQHPTLAARDAYAARGGWIAERAAVVTTYHDRFGKFSQYLACPEMFEEAA